MPVHGDAIAMTGVGEIRGCGIGHRIVFIRTGLLWEVGAAGMLLKTPCMPAAQIHAGGSVLFSDLQSAARAALRWLRKNLEGGV